MAASLSVVIAAEAAKVKKKGGQLQRQSHPHVAVRAWADRFELFACPQDLIFGPGPGRRVPRRLLVAEQPRVLLEDHERRLGHV